MSFLDAFGGNPLWYITRATGIVGFVLLTVGTVLGVAATHRAVASPAWPRFAVQAVHRNVNVLGLLVIALHIVTNVMDSYVDIGWLSVLVPFTSAYQPLPVALGTLAFDLLLAVAVTGMLRLRVPRRAWRVIHVSAYVAWPLALGPFLLAGTDAHFRSWGFWLGMAGLVSVAAAGVFRLATRDAAPAGPVRSLVGASR
jgi:methionine sulfoxide reductase heme-binding subunit